MVLATGDVVRAKSPITPSGGLGRTAPVGAEGIVTAVYPPGQMVSPYDGHEYALKVHFPGYLNLCRCFDGCYHVADFEVEKIEVTDGEIAAFLADSMPESDAA